MPSHLVQLFAIHCILSFSRVTASNQCPVNCTCASKVASCNNIHYSITGPFPDDIVNVTITNSNLTKLKPNIFGAQFRNILIERSDITEIDSYTFTNMTNLKTLLFKGVFIQRIKSCSFHNITSPAVIDFSECTINELESGAISYLSGIERISISLAQVDSIHTHAFYNIVVREFLVTDTDITNIKTSSFCSIFNVENFIFYEVNINTVEAGAFNNIHNIQNVKIEGCKFKELHCNAIMQLREATPGNHDTFVFINSQLVCNCTLTPMVNYAKNHQNAIRDSVICVEKSNALTPLINFTTSNSCTEVNKMCASSDNLNSACTESSRNLSSECVQVTKTVILLLVIMHMLPQ